MPFYYAIHAYIFLGIILLSLSACDFNSNLSGESSTTEGNENNQTTQLTLAVAPQVGWMPWYLANEEGIFHQETSKHQFQIKFRKENYIDTIEKFINEEVHAIAISNVDAIAQIVRRGTKADVILISNNHIGSEAILLPQKAEASAQSIRGKTFALVQHAAPHYLLDRYLIHHQIPFDQIKILNTAEVDISKSLVNSQVHGIVTGHPNLYNLTHSGTAKILFDSRLIPNEIFDLLVVRRETLVEYPEFAQILLKGWFSVMKRLQGNRKGRVLEAVPQLYYILMDNLYKIGYFSKRLMEKMSP